MSRHSRQSWGGVALCALLILGAACGESTPAGGPDGGSGPRTDGGTGPGDAGSTRNEPPSVIFFLPDSNQRFVAGLPFRLEYADADPDSDAVTELFADRDGDLASPEDGVGIATARPERNGERQALLWETQGLSPGAYYLIARISDGVNAPVVVRSSHPVTFIAAFLQVENLSSGETLRYDLALLTGSVPEQVSSIHVSTATGARHWPAAGGRFKVLVPLARGANAITLSAGGAQSGLTLTYQPQTNPRFLRLVYVVAQDGDGRFDAPSGEPNDVASAVARLKLGGRLMQTFTAETLAAEGLGRRTFELERDSAGEPRVEVFRSSLTLAQARSMEGLALWQHFYGELSALPRRADSIDVVLMSMTHYEPATQTALAHTALGGGRLALFGSGTLHTWADSLDQLVARWTDARQIDTQLLFDDSAGRGTFWANYATGLGATLHEAGHCLSLPHPRNGKGVMAREFDHLNRLFMITEPPSLSSPGYSPVLPEHERGWDRSAAVRLRFHRWLLMDNSAQQDHTPEIQTVGSNLEVSSPLGIRHIAYHVGGEVAAHDEFLTAPQARVQVSLAALATRLGGASSCLVTTIDDHGNLAEQEITLP